MPSEVSLTKTDHDLQSTIEELKLELAQARHREAATIDVLKAIGRSAKNVREVLDTLTKTAVQLCNADRGLIRRREGDRYVLASAYAFTDTFKEQVGASSLETSRESIVGRAALDRKTVHIPDMLAEPGWVAGDWQTLGNFRSAIAVPILRNDDILGVLVLHRTQVLPFSDHQIALLEFFADQAAIAIENARLVSELSNALEEQKTSGEILRAMSNSPTNAQLVLSRIAESAARLLGVNEAEIMRVEGDNLKLVTKFGPTPQWPVGSQRPINRNWVTGRAVADRLTVQVPDLRAAEVDFPEGAAFARQHGHRTTLATPLLREGLAIGALLIRRMEVSPFSNQQIRLLESFADQAVIAIENTRLFNETKQALERQTATSDVLQVISSSPGNLQPVFDTILANAVRLCEAKFGTLYLREGDAFRAAALHNAPPAFVEFWQRGPHRPGASTVLCRVLRTKEVVHISDITADQAYIERDPLFIAAAELGGFRTVLAVPMLKEADVLGAIYIYRQEVRSFSDKHIALLVSSFTRQAVIAIENTRLLRELRQRTDDLSESLEQQTATSEVLHVISRSPGDLKSVFRTMLENATRICDAKFGVLQLYEDGAFRIGAIHNAPPAFAEAMARREPLMRPTPQHPFRRMVTTKEVVQIADLTESPAHKERDYGVVHLVELASARTFLAVPMLKENEVIGVIAIYRQEVRAFTDKQIAVVVNFAAQAVIAIENTRLLNELRRIPAAADGDSRRAQGHQPLSVRSAVSAAGVGRISGTSVRRRQGHHYPADRWRVLPRRIVRLPRRSHGTLEKRACHARAR